MPTNKLISNTKTVGVAFISVIFIAGCATGPSKEELKQQEENDPKIESSLTDAVNNVSEQLHLLRSSENNKKTKGGTIQPVPKTGPLSKKITMNWSGPLEPAIKSISQLIGFKTRIIGKKPTEPVLVAIDSDQKAAFSILQDVGEQAGSGIGVHVNESKRTIAISYEGQRKGAM